MRMAAACYSPFQGERRCSVGLADRDLREDRCSPEGDLGFRGVAQLGELCQWLVRWNWEGDVLRAAKRAATFW